MEIDKLKKKIVKRRNEMNKHLSKIPSDSYVALAIFKEKIYELELVLDEIDKIKG